MKVIVGLGNPGLKYADTRHNVGFQVVDELAKRRGVSCNREKWHSLIGECQIGDEKVLLCKPQTFMNLSGQAVQAIVQFYSSLAVTSDLIIVYDDMDFPVGQFRLREQGTAGGHNGIKSIIAHLGTDKFQRVRLGIGRPKPEHSVLDHVLGHFSREESKAVIESIQASASALEFAIENTFHLAMNHFNNSSKS